MVNCSARWASRHRDEVDLIRHAYVRTRARRQGVGTRLLAHLMQLRRKAAAHRHLGRCALGACAFYEKNGFRLLSREETGRLLRRFWNIPERQVETSVVLASPAWNSTLRPTAEAARLRCR